MEAKDAKDAEMEAMCKNHSKEVEKVREEYEEATCAKDAEVEALEKRHSKAVEKMKKEHEEATEATKEAMRAKDAVSRMSSVV